MEAMLFDSLLAELSGVKNPSYHATNKTGTGEIDVKMKMGENVKRNAKKTCRKSAKERADLAHFYAKYNFFLTPRTQGPVASQADVLRGSGFVASDRERLRGVTNGLC